MCGATTNVCFGPIADISTSIMAFPLGRLPLERSEGEGIMLKTALCEVLGIEVPIILAAMGGTASSGEFAAAVSNQGGLGRIGSLFRATAAVKRDIDVVRELRVTSCSRPTISARK
jgi:hypothetical protein